MKTCQECLQKGGQFSMYFGKSNQGRPTLNELSFQPKLKKRVDLYSDALQVDIPHMLSKCLLVSMFPAVVDYFMKTINFRCSLMQTENNVDVTRGLTGLELRKMKVIMSDGSLALAKSAQELGLVHALCVKHLSSSFASSAIGVKGTGFKRFMDAPKKLLHEKVVSESRFDEEMDEMIEKF
eukprot:snap_masked-scaffold_31-processed-gene-3.7-mRNA-1 protein AED:1.00 eAED:1.00 QI:0/-1/0/0/-1/1/1/0/180